jgi:hypothetical protein
LFPLKGVCAGADEKFPKEDDDGAAVEPKGEGAAVDPNGEPIVVPPEPNGDGAGAAPPKGDGPGAAPPNSEPKGAGAGAFPPKGGGAPDPKDEGPAVFVAPKGDEAVTDAPNVLGLLGPVEEKGVGALLCDPKGDPPGGAPYGAGPGAGPPNGDD